MRKVCRFLTGRIICCPIYIVMSKFKFWKHSSFWKCQHIIFFIFVIFYIPSYTSSLKNKLYKSPLDSTGITWYKIIWSFNSICFNFTFYFNVLHDWISCNKQIIFNIYNVHI